MIEWLSFFGATGSDGVTRLLYSKERMRAQKAMKAEDGKKLITYFDSVALGGPSGGIILTSPHIETDKGGWSMTAHMGSSAILSGSAVIR